MVYWLSSDKAHDKQQKHFRELCSVPRTKKYLPGRQHSNSCTWRRKSQTPNSKQNPWNCPWLASSVVCTKTDQELILSGYLEMDLCTIQWCRKCVLKTEAIWLITSKSLEAFDKDKSPLLLVLGVEVTAQKRRPKLVSSKMIPLSSGGI